MKIATAEFPDEISRYDGTLEEIARHVEATTPDLLVLPEMPFTPWIFHTDQVDPALWEETVVTHAARLDQFARDIPVPVVSSRPVNVDGRRLNQAFFLDRDRVIHPLRSKYYLPNDFPAVEVPWFDRGDPPEAVFDIDGTRLGVQLCSEILYAETPRSIAGAEGEILIQPRATGANPRWRAAAILAAGASGLFVVGANRHSVERDWFSGTSWIYNPDGDLLAETSATSPIVSVEIDPSLARSKAAEYPLTMFRSYRDQGL